MAQSGLHVNVLYNNVDCTNGGISTKFKTFTLVGNGVSGPFEPSEEFPALYLCVRHIGGREYKYVQPAPQTDTTHWYMMGGNHVYTPDSRFPNTYPLPLHDRREW
jgi:hypothetical protein